MSDLLWEMGVDTDVVEFSENGSEPPEQAQPIFQPLSLSDLLAMPAKAWIIDGIIGAGDLAMVYGAPGSAKTFVAIDLILDACLGRQFAMRFDVARPLNVAYCAGEGVSGLPARFKAAAASKDLDILPNFSFFANVPQLHVERDPLAAGAETIHNFVVEWQARQEAGQAEQLDLLCVDTLHSAIEGADENSSQHMGKVLHAIKQASRALGCSVMLVHHTNKSGSSERGSSALRGSMDAMIEVKSCGGKFSMECAKLKDGERWKSQTFDLVQKEDSVRVWWDPPIDTEGNTRNEKATALVAELKRYPGTKFTARSLAEAVGGTQSAATNALGRLVDNGEVLRELSDQGAPSSNRNPWVYYTPREE